MPCQTSQKWLKFKTLNPYIRPKAIDPVKSTTGTWRFRTLSEQETEGGDEFSTWPAFVPKYSSDAEYWDWCSMKQFCTFRSSKLALCLRLGEFLTGNISHTIEYSQSKLKENTKWIDDFSQPIDDARNIKSENYHFWSSHWMLFIINNRITN